VDATGLNLGATTASGNLNVKAAGNIIDTGTITAIAGLTTLNAGSYDITLDTPTNDFKTVFSTGRNLTLEDANALNLGVSTLSGSVGITSQGTLTLLGNLNAANDVTLKAFTVDMTSSQALSAKSLTLTATGEVGGVSANIFSPLGPKDVTVISAPGKVLLNGTVIYP